MVRGHALYDSCFMCLGSLLDGNTFRVIYPSYIDPFIIVKYLSWSLVMFLLWKSILFFINVATPALLYFLHSVSFSYDFQSFYILESKTVYSEFCFNWNILPVHIKCNYSVWLDLCLLFKMFKKYNPHNKNKHCKVN